MAIEVGKTISDIAYFRAVVDMAVAVVASRPSWEPEAVAHDAINRVNAILNAINERNDSGN